MATALASDPYDNHMIITCVTTFQLVSGCLHLTQLDSITADIVIPFKRCNGSSYKPMFYDSLLREIHLLSISFLSY
jgi:hypothetical protein